MANFKVGQKVICIDDNSFSSWKKSIYEETGDYIKTPIKGIIYTIRTIQDGEAILLEEIVNKTYLWAHRNDGRHEPAFLFYHFRELIYESATNEILKKFPLTEERADVEIKEFENV